MKNVVVSMHDVAPSTAETSRRWLELLEARGIKVSLLVVPGQWNGSDIDTSPTFLEWLSDAVARGHEVVQHGYSHVRNKSFKTNLSREIFGSLMARGCEEFWHLPYGRAYELMNLGRQRLRNHGFTPTGFIAPGWLISPEALQAATDLGFGYVCTHTRIIHLPSTFSDFSLTTSQRPHSPLSGIGVLTNKFIVDTVARNLQTVRIAIHPNDLFDAQLRRANLALCDGALVAGRQSLTYGAVVASEKRWSNQQHLGIDVP